MYKLYTPKTATAETPAPGVLLLHGYQNDHETCAAYAIELARRGAVVLCLDEYGHGSTTAGLINRGYVNHKVTVNYGEDSVEDGTFKTIGGQTRYKVMMNFSNLSFFDKHYTTDADGNSMTDSSAGGSCAYALLAAMDNVDPARLAISGHSMGTWSSWSVAANFCGTDVEPKAVVLQCGELFRDSAYDAENIHFNNVLLLQAKYDEFSYFRDYKNVVDDDLLKSDLRTEFLGCTADEAAWNTTYGSFEDGTARCKATYQPGFKGFLGCWWRNALMMVGGILIIVLIEYIPFFMNIAPGADLLFGSTFGGPFMSLLILFVPQVLVFSVLYTYRRTGSVYVGALTAASLACWIVTGGSSML